ncbi:hypothetical protein RFI_26367, partial [Reticulomyxa filosa]
MDNQTTTQNSLERETEQLTQNQRLITPFQTLEELPIPLSYSQCVWHKHELIICGGKNERVCYSYHTIKNEYEYICDYPSDVKLDGHCVVKLVDNKNKDSNQTTLLSFGGKYKHTLVMKYVSVWNELNNYNEWIPFTDNHNNPLSLKEVKITTIKDNNNLLFITYRSNNISVFDLNTFQFIKHDTLPTNNNLYFHCFVSNSENGQGQEMTGKNKQKYQMLLFKYATGLLIEYDEDNNTFQCHQLPVCENVALSYKYAYVFINDFVLFFGGWNMNTSSVSKSLHKYSIRENKWTTFENTLPSPLRDCVAILSEEDNHIHIIGGNNDKGITVLTHMKTKVHICDPSQLSTNEMKFIIEYWIRILKIKLGWINDFNKI